VAAVDVRKSITFCRRLQVPVLGVVENMSGFVCPKCGEVTQILRSGGGKRIAEDMRVPFLGSIPMDPKIAEAGDSGRVLLGRNQTSPMARAMDEIITRIVGPGTAKPSTGEESGGGINTISSIMGRKVKKQLQEESKLEIKSEKENKHMRIAIPLANEKLAMHFGHCERFALVDVDPTEKKILKREDIDAPPHQPGLLPPWLAERGVNMIIAGGMGQRAQGLFAEHGIQVVFGAPADTPERLVGDYLTGTLQAGENVCDH
jgi:predicted Fe-Mo cluster-binding NifX family protein/predicted RNA-binding Zn-ribbon protein involved in translation (DUF1610 family)